VRWAGFASSSRKRSDGFAGSSRKRSNGFAGSSRKRSETWRESGNGERYRALGRT